MVIDKILETANELRIMVANLNEKMVEAARMGISIEVNIEHIQVKNADGSVSANQYQPLLSLDMTIQL